MNKHKSLNLLKTKISLALVLSALLAVGCGKDAPLTANYFKNPNGAGPAPLPLSSNGTSTGTSTTGSGDPASAAGYVILTKTGISNVTGSAITGNIAVSPAAASYITGFSLTADSSNVFSTSSSVTGKVYAANYAVPTPTNLTSAIGSMETAYTNAAGMSPPDFNELGTGNVGGLTLTPGIYAWSTGVTIPLDVTLAGGANDVWVFQIAGNLLMSAAKNVILSGGAQAKNIFWIVAGQVTIGTTSHFEGIILTKTAVTLQTLASLNGRIFAQTMVALDNNTIVQP